MSFQRTADEEERSLQDIPEEGPYPVAMHVSEDGLNRLLAGVIDDDVPFAGEVPFGILPQGPGEATFQAESAPVIELVDIRGCENCLLFTLDFGVELQSESEPLSSGLGFAQLSIPLRLQADEVSGSTTLVADYSQAHIEDWYLSVFGFDSETHTTLSGALQLLLEEEIQAEYGEVELLELGSWNIGQGEVKLVARELFVLPETKQLVLGMHTNLVLGDNSGVDLQAPLPEGVAMGVAFDVELMLDMSYRMMFEGEIPRRYDEEGRPDPNGIYGVTIHAMNAAAGSNKTLSTQFRVWRIAEGYCGFANVDMPLTVSLDETMTTIDVRAGDAVLVPGDNEGIGVAAEEEQRLVDDNQDLVSVFRKELSEEVAKTLNYEDLSVDGSRILFQTQDIVVEPLAINTYIDFIVVAAEE
jgi:hypothetical protein